MTPEFGTHKKLSRGTLAGLVAMLIAFISLFVFPWPLTAMWGLVASAFFPLAALALGLSMDALYYPGTGVPWATLAGLFASIFIYFVRVFLRKRIL